MTISRLHCVLNVEASSPRQHAVHAHVPSLPARSAGIGRGRRAQGPRASARRPRSGRAREHGREHGGGGQLIFS
jgi:hypothetical protein